jgi:uncharacterized protein YqhQ
MSTFQMSILLGFNNSLSLSIKDLQQTTQLPEKELIKQVQSLLEAKLLVKQEKTLKTDKNESEENTPDSNNPKNSLVNFSSNIAIPLISFSLHFEIVLYLFIYFSKSILEEINENTIISLNLEYSNKRTKFKILSAVQKETPQVC